MPGLRLAARRLAGTPGFTLVSILTIALAMGSATAIFALVDAVVLKPLPYADSQRLLRVSWWLPSSQLDVPYLRPEAVREWRKLQAFAVFEPYQRRAATLIGAGEPQIVATAAVGSGLMATLGVEPLMGRTLDTADAVSAARVAVIGEQLWRTHFGGAETVLGSTLRLDNEIFQIIGVMPSRFRFPTAAYQVWVPIAERSSLAAQPRSSQAIARLRSGVSIDAAEAQMNATARAMGVNEASSYGWNARLRPLGDSRAEPTVRLALFVLFGSVAVLLLIACGNLSGLMLVRGSTRAREMAVRVALGATRARLIGPLLWETIIITTAASAAGVLLTAFLIRVLIRFSPSDVTRLSYTEVDVDARVLIAGLIAAAFTVIVMGLLPSWWVTRAAHADALRTGPLAGGTRRQQRFRNALVAGQVALSVVLLIAAGLLGRTLVGLSRVQPGFDVEHVLGIGFTVQEWKYPTVATQQQLFARMLERVRQLPGVRQAELSGGMPPAAGGTYEWRIETDDGRVVAEDRTALWFNDIGPEYFAALGMPLREGRAFTRSEVASGSPSIILGHRLARRLWPAGRVTGHRIRFGQEDRWYSVVGVANDVLERDQEQISSSLAAYFPLSARVPVMRTVVVRTAPDPAGLKESVRSAIGSVDPEQPIAQIATAREAFASALLRPKFYAYVMGVFAGLAALLAGLGLYGVVAYTTAQRVREFGLRLAIGAEPRQIRRSVLRQGLSLAASGAAAGVLASLAAARVLESLLVGVRTTDPATYGTIVSGIFVLTTVACGIPARRAGAIDPAVTLRAE